MRLDKLLAHMGYGTRREVKKLIKSGAVEVNGAVPPSPDVHVDPAADRVTVYEEPVRYVAHVVYMLNKPPGVVSATVDRRQETVLDLVPAELWRPGLFPVGRLDKDARGLLLITDDGQLGHRLAAPRWAVEKTYIVEVDGVLTEADVRRFAAGMMLDDGTRLRPATLEIVASGPRSMARVTVTEGKYHQVKRMFLAVGKAVVDLKRIRIGPIVLDPNLPEGAVRPLTPEEGAALRAVVGLEEKKR
ncbi:MAG: rRNA pseudouridine synthase [Hydrogenibacillus schlegelii]|nr:rRNA pseudouridine synthase [Hydrogenibacillus schlegelii]